jgi:hypothetical protein
VSEKFLLTTEHGISHYQGIDDNGIIYHRSVGETDSVTELNKAMRTHNDGYSPSRELRRVASIPYILIHKWQVEEGWNALDPANADRLVRKLNDPDYAFLRTADGNLGYSNGVIR